MSAHTNFMKGTPVFVQMKGGKGFLDTFIERRSKFVILGKAGRVAKEKIRAISIDRGGRKGDA